MTELTLEELAELAELQRLVTWAAGAVPGESLANIRRREANAKENLWAKRNALLAMARELIRLREEGWVSTKERPLEVGEERLMAMQILHNGEPRWYMFVATPDDDDEWAQDGEEPGWPPSEVEFSRPLPPPATPVAELKGGE